MCAALRLSLNSIKIEALSLVSIETSCIPRLQHVSCAFCQVSYTTRWIQILIFKLMRAYFAFAKHVYSISDHCPISMNL
jgi:hypothetical protein